MKKKLSMGVFILFIMTFVLITLGTTAFADDGKAAANPPVIDLTQIVITIVGLVFSAVVIPLTKAGFELLKSKTRSDKLRSALDEAETVADNAVAYLQANVVEGLKAKSLNGKLSAADIKSISGQAVDMFIRDISAGSLEVLQNNADDITAYIRNLIEARLAALKKDIVSGLPLATLTGTLDDTQDNDTTGDTEEDTEDDTESAGTDDTADTVNTNSTGDTAAESTAAVTNVAVPDGSIPS